MIVQLEVLAFTTQGSGAWYDFMLNIRNAQFHKKGNLCNISNFYNSILPLCHRSFFATPLSSMSFL
jgi:hypothetical protein